MRTIRTKKAHPNRIPLHNHSSGINKGQKFHITTTTVLMHVEAKFRLSDGTTDDCIKKNDERSAAFFHPVQRIRKTKHKRPTQKHCARRKCFVLTTSFPRMRARFCK